MKKFVRINGMCVNVLIDVLKFTAIIHYSSLSVCDRWLCVCVYYYKIAYLLK